MSRILLLVAALPLVAFAACDAPEGGMDPALALGIDPVIGQPAPITSAAGPEPGPTSAPRPPIGESCQSGNPNQICLALKYVTYIDPTTELPVIDQAGALNNLQVFNQLWSQCGIGFQIEQFISVQPSDYGLNFNTASLAELDQVRSAFADNGELLVVTTGTWDRSGTLGQSEANAWTTMPGTGPYGTVLEEPVSTIPNMVGHELGHYLNLLHVSDDTDLMNPIIYTSSMALTSDQCSTVRAAAAFFWPQMYR